MMQSVKVRDLQSGQTVANDVSNLHGQVIMPAGTVIAPRLLGILKAWGIAEVTVEGNSPESLAIADHPTGAAPVDEGAGQREAADPSHPAVVEIMNLAARLKQTPVEAPSPPAAPPAPASARTRKAWAPISAETVAQRAGTLASLPTIHFKVERAINHPASSSADIAAALGSDQALCARLLRIANSAFYGFPRHVEGIGEAVRVIGTRQLHDLVLATVVLSQFRGVDPKLVSMKSFLAT